MGDKSKAPAAGSSKRSASATTDPLEGSSAHPLPPKRSRAKAPAPAATREEQRRHRAMEKAFSRAAHHSAPQQAPTSSSSQTLAETRESRDLSPDRPPSAGPAPPPGKEPLFQTLSESIPSRSPSPTPPVATPAPAVPPQMPEAFEAMLTRVIREGFAQCFQQVGLPIAPPPQPQQHHYSLDDQSIDLEPEEFVCSGDLATASEHEEAPDAALSDDEGLIPDQSPFIGLFNPQLFRSLLFKAIATTRLGEIPPAVSTPSTSDPASALFAEPVVAPETVPAPKLFLDVLQRQWSLPGAGPSPNNLDKRLYNSAPALADLLQPPSVDPPIVALTNPVHPTGPPEDSLRPEDKRAEKTLVKGHLAAAWSIRASSSASFFNRAALLWLKQLQDRLARTDLRAHQDLNKIAAALEYSADATLNATRFAARALGSSITSRRLLWLRGWQADIRSKWQLASAPYSAGSLFGPPLEPLLIETRDKRKILPSQLRRSASRYSPYPRPQSFRGSDSGSFQPRYHRPTPPRSQHLDSQVRSGGGFQSRRSFRGGRGRFPKRGR